MSNEDELIGFCNYGKIFADDQEIVSPKYTKESIQDKDNEFTFFYGHTKGKKLNNCCFSQWWQQYFKVNDLTFFCMEQFMMGAKAILFGDKEIFEEIMKCPDPANIKALGRKVKNFDKNMWNKWKFIIVRNGNYYKFSQNEDLKEYILNTGDTVIVEASPYDRIWGIGMPSNNENASFPSKWRGSNLLGFALMEVRDAIKN